jgi:hypothetical protein
VDGGITALMSVPGRKIFKNQNNLKHLTLKTFYKKRNLFSIFRRSFLTGLKKVDIIKKIMKNCI